MQIWINKENFILYHQKDKGTGWLSWQANESSVQSVSCVGKKMGGTDETVVITQRPRMTQFGQ